MTNNSNAVGSSFPLCSILSIIFVIFKLIGYFPYSWWIVFLPIWGPLALILLVFVLPLIAAAVALKLTSRS